MAKFKLQPDPTFKRRVSIPVPGDAKAGDIEFTFKFRSRDSLSEFYRSVGAGEIPRVDAILAMATGWDLSDEFNAENVKVLDETFIGALERVVEAYWDEHTKALEKN